MNRFPDTPGDDGAERLAALEREYEQSLQGRASVQAFAELQKRVEDLVADLTATDAPRDLRQRALGLFSKLEQQIRKVEQPQRPPRAAEPTHSSPPPSISMETPGRRWSQALAIAAWCVVIFWFFGIVPWIFFAYGPGRPSQATRGPAENLVPPSDPAAGMDSRQELAVRGSVPGPVEGSFIIPKDALDLVGLSIARQLEDWPKFRESLRAAAHAGHRRDVIDEVLLACAGARKNPNPHAFAMVFVEAAAHDLLTEAQARRELRAALEAMRRHGTEEHLPACLAGYGAARGRPVFERVARWAAAEGLTLHGPSEWTSRH